MTSGDVAGRATFAFTRHLNVLTTFLRKILKKQNVLERRREKRHIKREEFYG